MSLEYAILGFLNYHPYTGYDLKKIFDTSVNHFWHADQSQIYRTLARLTEQGHVQMEKVPQEDRPTARFIPDGKGTLRTARLVIQPAPMASRTALPGAGLLRRAALR